MLVRVLLRRTEYTDAGTFGVLEIPRSGFSCLTCEPPWLDNRRGRSCIPVGEYPLVPGYFNRHGYATWELKDVPGRSLIKVHRGNTARDTKGCILLGLQRGWLYDRPAVLRSIQAHRGFMRSMAGAAWARIIISDAPSVGKEQA